MGFRVKNVLVWIVIVLYALNTVTSLDEFELTELGSYDQIRYAVALALSAGATASLVAVYLGKVKFEIVFTAIVISCIAVDLGAKVLFLWDYLFMWRMIRTSVLFSILLLVTEVYRLNGILELVKVNQLWRQQQH